MTNNFSTIKNNQASSKFNLLRMAPRRVINDTLIAVGGGIYECTFKYSIAGITANGVALTLVTTVSAPGDYSYNETTQVLRVYSTPSVSNIIVVSYYLFYTGGRFRVANEDPENLSTAPRNWEPRIIANPSISLSIENVIQGNLSVSLSGVTLINNEFEFHEYLTTNDSFNKCEAKIWLCLDNINNIQKIYDGRVAEISISDSRVKLTFEDPYGELLNKAYMGDDADDCYYNITKYPNMENGITGVPIPYIIGKTSRYNTVAETNASLTTAEKLDQDGLYYAHCTNYSTNITTSNNRDWTCCRVSPDGVLNFGFTPSDISNADANYTRLTGTAAEVAKIFVGDTFEVFDTSYYPVRVIYIDRVNNYIYVTKEASISTGGVVITNTCPSIVVTNESNETYYCLYGRDYTATTTATASLNEVVSISFVDNFEANHPGMSTLDPGSYRVKYRVKPDITNAKHGLVVKSILENVGLTVDASSIAAANLAFDSNCVFSIPQFDEGDFKRYIDYLQLILASALSYITLGNDFEIEYHLLTAPSSTEEVTNIDILQDTMNIKLDYKDIAHQVIAYNPHWSNPEGSLDSSSTGTSLRNKYLHNINNADRFRHVLEKITTRISAITEVRSNRKAAYDFDTKAINLDNILGDDLRLKRNGILGNETYKQLKIISISKSPSKVNLIASDLLGL